MRAKLENLQAVHGGSTEDSDPQVAAAHGCDRARRAATRILIVDDEVHARAVLAELLREEGYLVETAGDGRRALPKLVAFAPDLLLTDLEMPGMDGLTLMRKAQQYDPLLPVVITTACGAIDTAVSAMRQGATDYLTKPLNAAELTLRVEHALEQRRAPR